MSPGNADADALVQRFVTLVECPDPLPSAESFAALLWRGKASVVAVADGAVVNPASCAWTALILTGTDALSDCVEITRLSNDPVVMQVASPSSGWTHTVAFYLAMESHGCFPPKTAWKQTR